MADYWKSQPRKFCEACKCWFGDNRASIDFHERGKRHKENVQRQLREARINAADKEKEKAKTTSTLQAIEKAAMRAYQLDLEVQVGLPLSQEARLIPQDESLPQKEEQMPGHKQVDFSAFQVSAAPSTTTVTPPSPPLAPPPPPSQWQQLTSPEGYWYYYNIITGVSQWEPPPNFQQPQEQEQQQHHQPEAPSTAAASSTTEGRDTNTDTATMTTEGGGHKRSADEADLEEREVHQRPKIRERPYGQWTTVTVRPQEPEEDKNEGVERNSEKERDKSGSDSSDNEYQDQSEKRVKYFQEKTLPSSSGTVVSGSFKGFGFKKRPGGGGVQKRPQIRQRTSEL